MTDVTDTTSAAWFRPLTGAAQVAGVIGNPIRHSLSPRMHGAWIRALDLDAAYVPLSTTTDHFSQLINGFRTGVIRGLNVTSPFKALALALADQVEDQARKAGAANLLLFHADGAIEARNTDGLGLIYALERQATGWRADWGPITIIGAGGAARGAVAALTQAGARDIRILNRTRSRAEELAIELDCRAFDFSEAERAFDGALTIINTTSAQLDGSDTLPAPPITQAHAVAMDMVYKPLHTPFITECARRGYRCVDGLDMLIGQAIPSFEAFFGHVPPNGFDIRSHLLADEPEGQNP